MARGRALAPSAAIMLRWIASLAGALGYWGIGLLMVLSSAGLPVPSEVVLPLGGFLAATGRLGIWRVIVVGTIGSVIGALPLYGGARALGKERLTRWIERHGRWLRLRGHDVERASARFERHGALAVCTAQLVPGLGMLISLPAGFARMNVALFTLANALGSTIWCGVLAWLGYLLGANFARVHAVLGPVGWIVIGALIVAGGAWVWRRRRRERDGGLRAR